MPFRCLEVWSSFNKFLKILAIKRKLKLFLPSIHPSLLAMDSPDHHPLPEYSTSDEEVNLDEESTDNDAADTDPECKEELEGLWKEFDEAKAELDAELEKEKAAREAKEKEEEEEEADRLMAEMLEDSDEGESDWDN